MEVKLDEMPFLLYQYEKLLYFCEKKYQRMKTKNILPFNWHAELEKTEFYSIENDVVLLDKPVITSAFQYPFKMDSVVAIICIKGTTEGIINLKPYTSNGSCLITILPGQVLEYKSISEDFSGLFIIMSPKFIDTLTSNLVNRLPAFFYILDNPIVTLDKEALEVVTTYFEMIKRVICVKDHPCRIETVKHLTLAFFYGSGIYYSHKPDTNKKNTYHETVVEKYLKLVQTHFKEQRGLEFYADKLCLTPKHLSKVIKQTSGYAANDWIDKYVVLEAKALLKSTNMTIQQISDELNFSSQSFFGKYFKRVTGVPPREYKRG